ncbi:class I SAM-dependent methyltransferase [Nocardioides convexus]|uniref:class I SAM-dependent methyltransferase n=1 Tax=Nocardioides convexus TaxID=2712224 RepID=UPI0031015317
MLDESSVVLDFGAGRGAWQFEPLAPYHRKLRAIDQWVERVVGVDVDPVVLENESLAEARLIEPGAPIPYDDETFDVVIADYVLEHVGREDAQVVADEVMRVLKPGGWFAARTPNKWGIIGLGARAVPNDLHTRVLTRLQPGRKAEDVFPVRYTMNTRKDLERLFSAHEPGALRARLRADVLRLGQAGLARRPGSPTGSRRRASRRPGWCSSARPEPRRNGEGAGDR